MRIHLDTAYANVFRQIENIFKAIVLNVSHFRIGAETDMCASPHIYWSFIYTLLLYIRLMNFLSLFCRVRRVCVFRIPHVQNHSVHMNQYNICDLNKLITNGINLICQQNGDDRHSRQLKNQVFDDNIKEKKNNLKNKFPRQLSTKI